MGNNKQPSCAACPFSSAVLLGVVAKAPRLGEETLRNENGRRHDTNDKRRCKLPAPRSWRTCPPARALVCSLTRNCGGTEGREGRGEVGGCFARSVVSPKDVIFCFGLAIAFSLLVRLPTFNCVWVAMRGKGGWFFFVAASGVYSLARVVSVRRECHAVCAWTRFLVVFIPFHSRSLLVVFFKCFFLIIILLIVSNLNLLNSVSLLALSHLPMLMQVIRFRCLFRLPSNDTRQRVRDANDVPHDDKQQPEQRRQQQQQSKRNRQQQQQQQ